MSRLCLVVPTCTADEVMCVFGMVRCPFLSVYLSIDLTSYRICNLKSAVFLVISHRRQYPAYTIHAIGKVTATFTVTVTNLLS
ncbi:hypothetical protein F4810DRAFT_694141 [Camillea tinctor]|nr:hypothetical protein F4810DRAFT_694141 [Camillea tinctor]